MNISTESGKQKRDQKNNNQNSCWKLGIVGFGGQVDWNASAGWFSVSVPPEPALSGPGLHFLQSAFCSLNCLDSLGFVYFYFRDCQMVEQRSDSGLVQELSTVQTPTSHPGPSHPHSHPHPHPQKLRIISLFGFNLRAFGSTLVYANGPLNGSLAAGHQPRRTKDKGHLETLARSEGRSLKAEK